MILRDIKTAVEINDDFLASAKALAAIRKQPLRRVLEDALVLIWVQQGQVLDGRIRLRKHTFAGNGLRPEFREVGWGSIREYAREGRGGVGRRE